MQPDPARQEASLAIGAFDRGDFPEAARRLVSLMARSRPDPTLLRLCGMALLRSGEQARGLPFLARARREAPDDPLAALWLGIAQHAAAQFEQAEATLQEAARLSPSDPAPLVHLARARLKCRRTESAVAAARAAIDHAPSLLEAWHVLRLAELARRVEAGAEGAPLAEAWLALGRICFRIGAVLDARAALHQALTAAPAHADAAAELATVEHLCGEPIGAIARLRATLHAHPDHASARLHLAAAMLRAGEAATALGLLDGEQPGAPPGPPLRAAWDARRIEALIWLGRHQEADAALAAVMQPIGEAEILLRWQHSLLARQAGDRRLSDRLAARTVELAADPRAARFDDRIDAYFALAAWRHAERDHDQAFTHWSRGHALLRAAQPFSRHQHAAFIETIMQRYDPDRVSSGARAGNRDPCPVFIVGLPRTGTSLTEHILAAHADIHGAGERLAIRTLLQELTQTSDAVSAIERASALDAATLSEAGSAMLASLHALSPQSRIIIDKMPDNFFFLGFIASLLPSARFICCKRDLRDVGASIFQRRFTGHHPYAHDLGDLGWSIARHERLRLHWRSVLGGSMIEIDHADWIGDFAGTLARALDFLDLPDDPACARFYEQDRPIHTASRDQVKRPINRSGVGRWRPYASHLRPMFHALERETLQNSPDGSEQAAQKR